MRYVKKYINEKADEFSQLTYRFDYTDPISGKRFRKQVKCKPSIVKSMYSRWQTRLLEDSSDKSPLIEKIENLEKQLIKTESSFLLFEKLNEYLEFCKNTKTETMFKWECFVIEKIVKTFFKQDKLLKDVNEGNVEDFILYRQQLFFSKQTKAKQSVANSSVNRTLAVCVCFFNFCIRRKYCVHNPFSKIKLKENNYREINLNKKQIKELLEKAEVIDKRLFNIIQIALLTGMRRGEIFSLEWSEVDFEHSIIRLSAFKTKSKKRRVIPITPILREILLSLMNDQSDLVLSNYTVAVFRKHWLKLLKIISLHELKNLHFHDLRHIFAQNLLNEGVSLEHIQAFLGHQDFATTQKRYANMGFSNEDLNKHSIKIDSIIQ
ncbi:MAG: site-specific integrase [Spirochaetota bacterium]